MQMQVEKKFSLWKRLAVETEVQINGYNHVKRSSIKDEEAVPRSGKKQILFLKGPGQDSQRTWLPTCSFRGSLPSRIYWEDKCTHDYNTMPYWELSLEIEEQSAETVQTKGVSTGEIKGVTFTTGLTGWEGLCKQRCDNRLAGLGQAKNGMSPGSWSTGSWQRRMEDKLWKPGRGRMIERLDVDKKFIRAWTGKICSPFPRIVKLGLRRSLLPSEYKYAVVMPTLKQEQTQTNKTSLSSYLLPAITPFSTLLFSKFPWKNRWHPIFSWTHFVEIFALPSTETTPMEVTHVFHVTRPGVSAQRPSSSTCQRPLPQPCALTFLCRRTSLVSPFQSLLLISWLRSNL